MNSRFTDNIMIGLSVANGLYDVFQTFTTNISPTYPFTGKVRYEDADNIMELERIMEGRNYRVRFTSMYILPTRYEKGISMMDVTSMTLIPPVWARNGLLNITGDGMTVSIPVIDESAI